MSSGMFVSPWLIVTGLENISEHVFLRLVRLIDDPLHTQLHANSNGIVGIRSLPELGQDLVARSGASP